MLSSQRCVSKSKMIGPEGSPGNHARDIESREGSDQLNTKASLKNESKRHVEYQHTPNRGVDAKVRPSGSCCLGERGQNSKGIGDPKRVETWQLVRRYKWYQKRNPSRKSSTSESLPNPIRRLQFLYYEPGDKSKRDAATTPAIWVSSFSEDSRPDPRAPK